MITVVIRDNGERNVVQLTYENLYKELKDIEGSDLIVSEDWFNTMPRIKNKYVCFVEADCLVSSGYFSSQLGLFKKNPYFRKLAMLSSAVGVNEWGNKFYGYMMGQKYDDEVQPIRIKKSNTVYPIQIGYFPGSIVRVNMLARAMETLKPNSSWQDDLVFLSTKFSLAFWSQGDGNRVHINPNTTYVTTEDYVNDLGVFEHGGERLLKMFQKESI